MHWILLVAISVVLSTIIIYLDNYISDVHFKGNQSSAQKVFFGWQYCVFAIIMFFIFGVNLGTIPILIILAIIFIGIMISVSSIFYYRALEIEDSTNIAIFTQLSPILYLIFGWFLLDEKFSPFQLLAFLTILVGPFLIVFTSRKNSRKTKIRAIIYASIYVLLTVLCNIGFIKITSCTDINFQEALTFTFLGKGIGNILITYVFVPKWKKRYRYVAKQGGFKFYITCMIDGILCLFSDYAYRLALITAPTVAIASVSSDSMQPISTFFMGILLTLLNPKLGREKLDKKTVMVHLIATAFVVVGIILLQI